MAAKRGHTHRKDDIIPLKHIFTPLMLKRFHDQAKVCKQVSRGAKTFAVADADQNSGWCAASWIAPMLVTHGSLVDIDHETILLGEEHLAMQGECIDEIQGADRAFRTCLGPVIKHLRKTHQGQQSLKKLAGNAMNLCNLYSFKLYCLANVKVIVLFVLLILLIV